MMKRPIYLFCTVCLAWSCTNDPITTDPARPADSPAGELVSIGLTLHLTDFEAPLTRDTRSIRATASGTRSGLVDVEISAIEPTPVTRTGAGEVSGGNPVEEEKIFRLDILQFNGIGKDAQLIKKAYLSRADGDFSKYTFKDLQFIETATVKNRIVVLGNAPASLSAGLQEKTDAAAGTTYGSLLLEKMVRTQENASSFPLITWNQESSVGKVDIPIFSGTATTTIVQGSQIGLDITRTIAKVNFEFLLSQAMIDAYSDWDIVLNSIPPASFYNPLTYEAPFPETQITEPYYSKVLAVGKSSPQSPLTPLFGRTLYLPVNLQKSVPGTVVSTRYLNAPVNGTSLQLLGKKIVNGSITQTVVYMIPLGANFSDDYSIRSNNAINYRITLVSDSPDDSSVVKFIAGKFAGNFRKFTNPADGTDCWGFEDDLEVWPTDVEYVRYPGDFGNDSENFGTWMPFIQQLIATNQGRTNLTDGLANTQALCTTMSASHGDWSVPIAAYMCYRQLNGLTAPLTTPEKHMWFLPAINQLVGIYVAGGSQVSAMQSSYWSSSMPDNAIDMIVYRMDKDGTIKAINALNAGENGESMISAAVRGCRIPPPGELEPK